MPHGRKVEPEEAERVPTFTAKDLDTFFTDTPGLVLVDSGTGTDGHSPDHWWEFTIDPEVVDGFPHCNFGSESINIVWVDNCDCYFVAGEEWTYRLWRLSHGDWAVSLAEGATVLH